MSTRWLCVPKHWHSPDAKEDCMLDGLSRMAVPVPGSHWRGICLLLLVHTLLRSATPQTCGHGDHMRARIICLHTLQGKITNVSADPYCHGSITLVCPVSMNEPARSLMANGQERSDNRHIGGEGTEESRRSEQMCAWADRQASSDPLAHSVVRVASAQHGLRPRNSFK